MGKATDFYGPPRGSAFTLVTTSAAANPGVPTNLVGAASYGTASGRYAATILGPKCEGVNIFGFTVTATDASARTIKFDTVDSSLDDYTSSELVLTIKASENPGAYYPIGGPRGVFFPGRLSDGTLVGGGFAFATSNNALTGILWWEPVGAY